MWWQAHKIGYDHLVGQVDDGLARWRAAGRATATIPLISAADIVASPEDTVLDIRPRREFAEGHIPGHNTSSSGRSPPPAPNQPNLRESTPQRGPS